MKYYFNKTVSLSFDDVIEKVIAELKKQLSPDRAMPQKAIQKRKTAWEAIEISYTVIDR